MAMSRTTIPEYIHLCALRGDRFHSPSPNPIAFASTRPVTSESGQPIDVPSDPNRGAAAP